MPAVLLHGALQPVTVWKTVSSGSRLMNVSDLPARHDRRQAGLAGAREVALGEAEVLDHDRST